MSDVRMTTPGVMNQVFEGKFAYLFKREVWFPIAFTVAGIVGSFLQAGFTVDVFRFLGYTVLVSLLVWAFTWVLVQRDIARSKYTTVAAKMDELLEHVDASWTWCERTQSYALHFTDDPHEDDSELHEYDE